MRNTKWWFIHMTEQLQLAWFMTLIFMMILRIIGCSFVTGRFLLAAIVNAGVNALLDICLREIVK